MSKIKTVSDAPPPIKPTDGYSIDRGCKKPDFDHWMLRAYWKVSEAAWLFCGCDPDESSQASNKQKKCFSKMFELVQRAYDTGEIEPHPSDLSIPNIAVPQAFTGWAANHEIKIPISTSVIKIGPQSKKSKL